MCMHTAELQNEQALEHSCHTTQQLSNYWLVTECCYPPPKQRTYITIGAQETSRKPGFQGRNCSWRMSPHGEYNRAGVGMR